MADRSFHPKAVDHCVLVDPARGEHHGGKRRQIGWMRYRLGFPTELRAEVAVVLVAIESCKQLTPCQGITMRRFLLTMFFLYLIVLPATATETIDAVWIEQEVDFTFISLGMAYSCDLLEGRIGMLLRHVGATDVHVTVPSCNAFKDPQRQLRVMARFSTLVLAVDGDGDIIKATWSEVELGKRHPRSIDDTDCELLEQFQKYLLPTIEHEVLEGTTGCSATKRSIVGRLKLRVLKPVAGDVPAKKDQ